MQQYEQVYQALKEMGIEYEVVEHPPAFTTEEADRYIDGKVGVRSKTLFLVNRNRSTFFLVIMDDSKRLDFKKLADLLSEKRVSFASSEQLMEKMQLSPGVVSLFGLLNNSEKIYRFIWTKICYKIKLSLSTLTITRKLFSFLWKICIGLSLA